MSADTQLNFGPFEWALSVGLALTWGSSFLLIDLSIRHFDSTVVPLARTALGALALAFLPGARQKIDRRDWPLVWFLGLVWMAVPFLLYPIAEQTVSSSITGMMNGNQNFRGFLSARLPHSVHSVPVSPSPCSPRSRYERDRYVA